MVLMMHLIWITNTCSPPRSVAAFHNYSTGTPHIELMALLLGSTACPLGSFESFANFSPEIKTREIIAKREDCFRNVAGWSIALQVAI